MGIANRESSIEFLRRTRTISIPNSSRKEVEELVSYRPSSDAGDAIVYALGSLEKDIRWGVDFGFSS